MSATQARIELEAPLSLVERMADARRRSDELFAIVKPEFLYERPIPERHRIIFYLGHLEAFDWNLLNGRAFSAKSLQPELDKLFAFGIDPVGGGLPNDQPSDWPIADRVRQYIRQVRQTIDENLHLGFHNSAERDFPVSQLLNVAIEHRLMHVETLGYMFHQLPLDQKTRCMHVLMASRSAEQVQARMIEISPGVATMGMNRIEEKFGWDNEFESDSADVPAFAIDRYKVTNGQYLEFMQASGYETRAFWTDDDWNWKTANQISHPAFWKQLDGEWLYRGMFEEFPLLLDAPVYVSHAEAAAYACWAGKKLPTEAEWHRAAYGDANGRERAYPWGSAEPHSQFGNFNLRHWDPTPVNAFPDGDSAFGVGDLIGNGWEWTSTKFAPFAGFEPFPFYRGYSADFFDGKHFVLKGGSARTADCMLRRSFRNWFQPHYQYVYAGFRCISR
jgi:ergothioneine biosynthesis protein EgtB